jgi:adenylate cyclase
VPYAVDGALDVAAGGARVISEHGAGLDLFIDPGAMDAASRLRVCALLENALAELKARA